MADAPLSASRKPDGIYSNCFEVGASAYELVIDFGFRNPEEEQCRVHTRILTSPALASLLLRLLERSVKEYEARFEKLPLPAPAGGPQQP
jgi:Protein of unknown function (DUF3467)